VLEVEAVVEVVVGEMLTLETPKAGVLTLEGSEALVMAVLELGLLALEVGGFEGRVTLEDEITLRNG
jgi:hypothetical protein